MSQEPKPTSWWHTMPGVLTAVAAILTAATGLVVALGENGVLGGSDEPPARVAGSGMVEGGIAGVGEPRAATVAARRARAPEGPTLEPEIREATLGDATYTLLTVDARPRNQDQLALRIGVRMRNDGPYPANFWDGTFRLLVGGVPRAPVGGLNAVVQGHSAEDGEVVFHLPTAPRPLALQLRLGEETVEIPLRRVRR